MKNKLVTGDVCAVHSDGHFTLQFVVFFSPILDGSTRIFSLACTEPIYQEHGENAICIPEDICIGCRPGDEKNALLDAIYYTPYKGVKKSKRNNRTLNGPASSYSTFESYTIQCWKFSHGRLYVALSRVGCKDMKKMHNLMLFMAIWTTFKIGMQELIILLREQFWHHFMMMLTVSIKTLQPETSRTQMGHPSILLPTTVQTPL